MFHQTVFPFETFHIIPRRHNCLVQVVICTGHLPVIFSLPLPRFATCDLKTKISLSDGPLKKLRPKEGVRGGGGGGVGVDVLGRKQKKKIPQENFNRKYISSYVFWPKKYVPKLENTYIYISIFHLQIHTKKESCIS